jgi:hypothetical protein
LPKESPILPKQRKKGLLIEALPFETIVYDTTTHKVHCLNPVAAVVWRHCGGAATEAELAQILQRELGHPADEALVHLTLDRLGRAGLLEGSWTASSRPSRREAVKRLAQLGVAAAAALVVSMAAPTAAMAATVSAALLNGSPCNASSQCASGCCCRGSNNNDSCQPVGGCFNHACRPG